MYAQPSNHVPRSNPKAPAPPSRWSPRVVVNQPGSNKPPASGYVRPKYRKGLKVTPKPGQYRAGTGAKPYSKPDRVRVKPARVYGKPINIPARVQAAVERAFPVPRPLPGYSGARAAAAGAARFAETAAEARATAEEVADAMDVIAEAMNGAYWNKTPGSEVVNPGLTFVGNKAHTLWTAPPSGSSPLVRPSAYGQSVQIGNPLPVPQNNWLLKTTLTSIYVPSGGASPFWWDVPSFAVIPNGYYYLKTIEDYVLHPTSTSNRYYRNVDVYRNNTGADAAPSVVTPAAWPLPLGAPLPLGMTKGYPVNKTAAAPKPWPMPRRFEEVAIDIPRHGPPAVYPSRPRQPGPKAKESKGYGKAAGVASFAFWMYEATDDWKDWVDIVAAAMPNAPQNVPIWEKLAYMFKHPEEVVMADWEEIIAAMAGWAVDEAFGAFVGNVNKRANRSTSVSSTTIDMRTNVVQHYSANGNSPGSFVEAYIASFL